VRTPVGGEQALHHLEDAFYSSVLEDPLLQPLFGAGSTEHVDHLTAFTASRSVVPIDSRKSSALHI
jgi:truncated hemoglobin YjbI